MLEADSAVKHPRREVGVTLMQSGHILSAPVIALDKNPPLMHSKLPRHLRYLRSEPAGGIPNLNEVGTSQSAAGSGESRSEGCLGSLAIGSSGTCNLNRSKILT